MLRSRLKNIVNKSKGFSKLVGEPFDNFKATLPNEVDENYRLEAAWKAYGSPKDFKEAVWNGMILLIDENTYKFPSIGYNEETDEYEYLNKGKENETVAKDIRVWDNDVIPLVKELKQGGYIRMYNDEKDCWTYTKKLKEEQVEFFLKGGKSSENIDTSRTSRKDLDDFDLFLLTLPPNLKNFDPNTYNMRRYWELNGKPKTFWESFNSEHPMFEMDLDDRLYHAGSVAKTPDGNYEFMKSPNHDSIWMEEAWYNGKKPVLINGKENNGKRENYNLEELLGKDKEESELFRNEYNLIKSDSEGNPLLFWKYIRKSMQSFKQGGQMSVIPEGALHARKNNMEGAGKDITAKGIPVVDNKGEQQAEIEKNEIIFSKSVTDKIEGLLKKYESEENKSKQDDIAIEMGKIITCEIVKNTDDRTGLISEVELNM